MSENVIERLIARLRAYEYDGYVPPEDGSAREHAEEAVDEVADWLQAATDPRQFMPRLDEWPQGAVGIRFAHMSTDPKDQYEVFFEFFLKNGRCMFLKKGNVSFWIPIPPGIDPRVKVSRSDMERWEAER